MPKTRDAQVATRLAANLKRLMADKEVNGRELALKCGISHATIYRFLDSAEESDPTASTLLRLCSALECTVEDLLGKQRLKAAV